MNRGPRQAANEAASRANDALVARAKRCPSCDRILQLGHFVGCPDAPGPAKEAKR